MSKSVWRKSFNSAYPKYGEESAIKIAWTAVKRVYKKKENKWIKKTKAEIEEAFYEIPVDDLIEIKKLEIFKKQSKLIESILEASEYEISE